MQGQQQQQELRSRRAQEARLDAAQALAVAQGVAQLEALLGEQSAQIAGLAAEAEEARDEVARGVGELRRGEREPPRALRNLALALFGVLAAALLLLDWMHP